MGTSQIKDQRNGDQRKILDRSASVPSIRIWIPEQPAPITRSEPEKNVRDSGDDLAERRLTVLAMQLAIFEKTVSRLSTLGFIWATVVLLGGFAITLSCTDFWCITTLLLIEGARIQGRSHELEWEQKATWRPPITAQAVAQLLHWLQLLSASVCVCISLLRLVHQTYGNGRGPGPWTNRHAALDIFYGLALVESLVFLVEKALWQWKVLHRRIIERIAKECNLATVSGVVAIRRFFYESYSRSLKGSIFDGLHMDLVSYADNLLAAGTHDQQSIGASIMVALAESDRFANSTLRSIGMSATTVQRLIQMLNWKNSSDRDVRRSAAVVVSMLTGKKLIALRVTGIPGAIYSVASLLYADLDDELNLLGLSILNRLAHDDDNCDKIGKTPNLLDKIISYCSIPYGGGDGLAAPPTDTRLKAVKQSLLLVKRLAGTTGTTGKLLRREISYIFFTVSNIREVLQQRDGRIQSELYQLAIETLATIAMDKEAREKIGGTGGVVKELVALFLPAATKVRGNRQTDAIRVQAGEALAMLSLESSGNCGEIIMACGGGVGPLVNALGDHVVTIVAARILRNLCTYVGEEWQLPLRGVTAGATKVLGTIMVVKGNILNIFLGLAAQMLRFMVAEELRASLAAAGVTETALAQTLLLIMREYDRPSMVVPRIRWYTIELAVTMMRLDARYVTLFVEHGMEADLRRIASNTSELECFSVFLGSVGLGRRAISVASLVTSALELMKLQR